MIWDGMHTFWKMKFQDRQWIWKINCRLESFKFSVSKLLKVKMTRVAESISLSSSELRNIAESRQSALFEPVSPNPCVYFRLEVLLDFLVQSHGRRIRIGSKPIGCLYHFLMSVSILNDTDIPKWYRFEPIKSNLQRLNAKSSSTSQNTHDFVQKKEIRDNSDQD